ncbi:unnamed protein product [Linum trigynum]|uniref:Late embryogenesis abundant protein n=1 Tax=Linum trigynum TaxID=586398 RepID=A0AAV2GB30_9ROSI
MAANWMSSSGRGIASLTKQLLFRNHWISASSPACSRGLHSAYEKNVEGADHDDQVIFRQPQQQLKEEDKFCYWEPHPHTGVFGPAAASGGAGASSGRASTIDGGGAVMELEEKAWFRPTSLEDLEKPTHLH